jgi:integrase
VRVFAPERFVGLRKPHEFWVPLLQLHHGLRVGEASQLAVGDVTCAPNGIWVLQVTDDLPGTTVKTIASRRTVPLHPTLVEMGFLDYIADIRRLCGEVLLFPYLRNDSRNGYGDVPGEAFNRYVSGVLNDRRKRSHSFRHTVNERLKEGRVHEEHRCEFVGHEYDTTNSGTYSQRLTPETMAAVVFPLLQFPLSYDALRYKSGRFDAVIRSEMRRRLRLQRNKATLRGK